jgi:hypothetical protein
MPESLSPQEFVARWRGLSLKERSASQSHFIDLCHLLGQRAPVEEDPTGAWYTFEAGAAKSGGGDGWADVWRKGCFAWEYKGPHKDLDAAYAQLQQYREALENPPLLIVSDMQTIVLHTNFTNTVKRVVTWEMDDLLRPDRLDQLRAIFTHPESFRSPETTKAVTEKAAAEFAALARLLQAYGETPEATARFCIRLLFCLFAEDVRLLPEGLFARLVRGTQRQPAAFVAQLRQLFGAMATGGWFGSDPIPYINGGLFDDATALTPDSDGLAILARVADLDWANIEPSALGTLFERGLDPAKRSQLGAHYTSREDILLIVEPVLMAPLRRRWAAVQAECLALAAKRDATKSRSVVKRHQDGIKLLLDGFAAELATVQVLDPACGSGNFLYVALRQLLDLWKEVSAYGATLGLSRRLPLGDGLAPHPRQMHGIELNAYAHELAQATLWIGYLQWLRENGYGAPPEPILSKLETVRHMDAILAHDAAGNPVEPEWPAADVIIGNPPFLGDKKMRAELGDAYVDELRKLYEGRIPGQSDLCCYWFERARAYVENGEVKRVGLLATQAIRGGANRTVLERIKATGDIFMAWADRDWVLDGATVHVSMVGFDRGGDTERELDGVAVPFINADLTSATDVTQAVILPENAGLSFIGTQKTGPFDLTNEQAQDMLAAVGNPNGRPNSDVIKPWVNAIDLTQTPRGMWIIYFGWDMSEQDAAQYERPFEYVRQYVRPIRQNTRPASLADQWWLLARPRPAMRQAVSVLSRYIATPMVSKHRVFVWKETSVIAENLVVVIARDDDYFLGVLHARPHELWARRQGTQLREASSGSRYTPTTTFETYPLPWPPGQEPWDDPRLGAIAQAAAALVAQREVWLNPPGAAPGDAAGRTLTALYNQRPTWLALAHARLDAAVFAAYGWPADLSDQEVLERLLALNLARAQHA